MKSVSIRTRVANYAFKMVVVGLRCKKLVNDILKQIVPYKIKLCNMYESYVILLSVVQKIVDRNLNFTEQFYVFECLLLENLCFLKI